MTIARPAPRSSSPASGTLADLLRDAGGNVEGEAAHAAGERGRRREQHNRLLRQALVPVTLTLGLFALWSMLAPIAGAVVAPATVKVELNRKTVAHQEGGIVREILVRDGQAVHAGDALVVVANLRADAELALLREQWRGVRGAAGAC